MFCLCYLYLFIYTGVHPARCPLQIMFVSFDSNTMSITTGAGTAYPSGAPEFTPHFLSGVRIAQYLVSVQCSVL